MSQAYFYVSGSGYVPWERSNDDRIELVADKGHYAPGEIAHVMVKSPFVSAPALVSFEREGILHHYATVLGGSAPQIDIPITSAMLPNVFISVVMLQGRSAPPSGTNEGMQDGLPSRPGTSIFPSARRNRNFISPSRRPVPNSGREIPSK